MLMHISRHSPMTMKTQCAIVHWAVHIHSSYQLTLTAAASTSPLSQGAVADRSLSSGGVAADRSLSEQQRACKTEDDEAT